MWKKIYSSAVNTPSRHSSGLSYAIKTSSTKQKPKKKHNRNKLLDIDPIEINTALHFDLYIPANFTVPLISLYVQTVYNVIAN